LGSATPSGLALQSGNNLDLLLALRLSGCSDWLLGHEGDVPGCFASGTDFLPFDCSSGTAAAEGAASGIDVDANVDSGAGAGILEGDLLELLGWVARETGTTAAPGMRSTNLALMVFHIPKLPFSHCSSIDQMLKGREGMVHQLVV
jgi:hypothetical protein